MLKSLLVLTLFLVVIDKPHHNEVQKPKGYSHFECIRKHRTVEGGLEAAVETCESIIKGGSSE